MGLKTAPCVEVNLDEKQEKELNIRLNKNHGQWNYDNLANFFDVDNLVDWGFDSKELNTESNSIIDVSTLLKLSFNQFK